MLTIPDIYKVLLKTVSQGHETQERLSNSQTTVD